MYYLEIKKNGRHLVTAGSELINRLVAILTVDGRLGPESDGGGEPVYWHAYLDVGGVQLPDCELEQDWLIFHWLKLGDIIEIKVLDKATPTAPLTDADFEAARRESDHHIFSNSERKGCIALECSINGGEKVIAGAKDLAQLTFDSVPSAADPSAAVKLPEFQVGGVTFPKLVDGEMMKGYPVWLGKDPLEIGDEIRLVLIDADRTDEPQSISYDSADAED